MHHRFVVAYGPWKWFLKGAGFRAITMPWRAIYVLEGHWHDEALRRHELVHIAQIDRCGAGRFALLYVYYLARYGYRDNPFEIEAYGEDDRRPGGGP